MDTYSLISHFMLTPKIILPLMVFILSGAILGKIVLLYLKRGTLYFTKEFSVRVRRHLRGEYPESHQKGFYDSIRFLTKKTEYEIFELRRLNHRRKFDHTKAVLDNLFLIEEGASVFFDDLADQVSYVGNEQNADWESFVKFVFSKNPVFNHLFGRVSIQLVNKLYAQLPLVLFILGSIGALVGYKTGLWVEPLFWGIISFTIMNVINILFDTSRYDDIILKTFSWSMFLVWSNRTGTKVQQVDNSDENILNEESDTANVIKGIFSDQEFTLATEETFNLLVEDDDIPDIPNAA